MSTFAIGEEDFLLDGTPHRVLSGALHYFRVHPDQWADRIHKARLMGLNTIETYIAWNEHAPTPEEFNLEGRLDLARFLDLVAAEGMHAIVRPGPFICAEWDGGGLPGWLFRQEGVGIRRSEPMYLAAVERFFDQVLPLVVDRQIDRGGPVILVQVENEYGAYGSDREYLETLRRMLIDKGVRVPLTTVDQPTDEMLTNGSLPGVHLTASFGSRSAERLAALRKHQPTGPLMCSEFWDGWFDHWGAHHHTTDVAQAAADLDELLSLGASVNIYMFHGGTNFGFTNGANDKGTFKPTVTSYDYDAPLSEDGFPSPKFMAFREVIGKYADVPEELPQFRSPAPVLEVAQRRAVPLASALPADAGWVETHALPTHDDVAAYRGFVQYRRRISSLTKPAVLSFTEVRDRAQVFLDGVPIGVLDRARGENALTLPACDDAMLEILVEDQGRVNYGPRIGEPKGLIGPALLGGEAVKGWEIRPVSLDRLDRGEDPAGSAAEERGPVTGPSFVSWDVPGMEPVDLFISTEGWGKGNVWFNGWNLGRFWSAGPQSTLYVPAPVVRADGNVVTALELLGSIDGVLRFVDGLRLGHTEF